MPRASARPGYTNRTDLMGPSQLPVSTAPGQGYGEASAQAAAQRALPMAPTQASIPSSLPAPAGAPTPPTNPALAGPSAPPPVPGAAGALTRPTERPNEPVTHGLPVGPGAGPEALTGIGAAARENAMGQATLGQLLSTLASAPGAPSAVQDLAVRAQGGTQ